MYRSTLSRVLVSFALMSPVVAGCSGEAPTEETQATGSFSAALQTTGSDGANYRFAAGTSLQLTLQSTAFFSDFIALDGTENQITRTLATGNYLAQLVYNGSINGPYQLEKTQNGATTLVAATLLNVVPLTFDILDGQTTALVLSFRVDGLGDLTFTVGNLDVTLNVSEQNTSGTEVRWNGTTQIGLAQNDMSLSAEAQALLAVNVGDVYGFSVVFDMVENWHLARPGAVCANGTITSITFPAGTGFGARMAQMIGAGGQACVFDNGGNDQVYITSTGFTTPPEQQMALPGAYSFNFFIDGYGGDVFNGTTFQQSLFEVPRGLSFGTLGHNIVDQASFQSVSYIQGGMNSTVQILP